MREDAALRALTHQRRPDAAPRPPPRLAGEGQGRRLRRPVRRRRSASTPRCWKPTSTASSVFDRSQHARLDLPGRRLRPGRPRSACRRMPPLVEAAGRPSRAPRCRPVRRPLEGTPKRLAVCAGRIHTVARATDRRRRHPGRERQDQRPSARAATFELPDGHAGADGRRGDAGADRRPHRGRPVRERSTSAPTRTRTNSAIPTRPTCACWTASTRTSRCWSFCASTA